MPDRSVELVGVEIGDWPPLGGDVRLKLAGRKTVLVGRNGVGKSALLEGIWLAGLRAKVAIYDDGLPGLGSSAHLVPRRFLCELRDPQGVPLRYEYRVRETLEERCSRPETSATCWQLQDGLVTFENGTALVMPMPAGVLGLSSYLRTQTTAPLSEVELLSDFFTSITRIPAGLPRQHGRYAELVVTIHRLETGGCRYDAGETERRIGRLAKALVIAYERDSQGAVREFEELGRYLGAWQNLRIDIYDPRRGPQRAGDDGRGSGPPSNRQLATVSFDGLDIGLQADGTLRVAEILWALVGRGSPGRNLLLLDEPETGLYPGLLAGLLDTIDAYAAHRQIILSTHSPQVVSWAGPADLRLVARMDGQTQIRSLSKELAGQIFQHLNGRTLGQYVYSGAMAEQEGD